jgi:hypothetical protein
VGSAARAHEIRVVCVREPVGVGTDGGEHRALLEHEYDVGRTGCDERVGDRLGALRIRNGMTSAVEDMEHRALPRGHVGEEARASELRRADLEVRVTRAAQRARAEKRAAQVSAATAAAGEHALRRALERPLRRVEHAGAVQRRVGVRASLHVQLVARRLVERVLLVGPDLRFDLERAQERERAPRDRGGDEVEVERDLPASAEVHAAGDVEETRELGEPIAVRLRRDLGELVAQIVR